MNTEDKEYYFETLYDLDIDDDDDENEDWEYEIYND